MQCSTLLDLYLAVRNLALLGVLFWQPITQVFVLIFERQKPLFLQNLAKNSAFECEAYDTLRLPFITNAQSVIENWEDLTQTECLKSLFQVMPRALARYVKNIFLYRREKIYK